jgi:HAD superfamily hydrolase (TIGR01549 family)
MLERMSQAKKSLIKAVLFDWDGTLLDSFHADSSAYLAMFREMGIEFGLEELAQHYSPNWYDVYRAAGLSEERWEAADKSWRKNYADYRPELIAGVRDVLVQIGGRYELGLVTSGDRDRVHRQLEEFGLAEKFRAKVCSGDTEHKKPHPGPLLMALQCMGLAAEQCVYVGDSPEDVQMAKSAGARVIGVLGPFPTEARLRAAEPDLLLGSLEELAGALVLLDVERPDGDGGSAV